MLPRDCFDTEQAFLEYCAYMHMRDRPDERTPKGTTWRKWYKRRFGRDYLEAEAEYRQIAARLGDTKNGVP